ncbi:hypothetical protein CC117_27305 [Parafrankia colletiae]|uniref:Uncharacterized protein n=1 Tax=Parafrankia colletiae TaxID=573497 RepID=A0A1S1QA45_9ACTN|nr:hypothetical protein CC117_27305 [Parafrankia colletiae]
MELRLGDPVPGRPDGWRMTGCADDRVRGCGGSSVTAKGGGDTRLSAGRVRPLRWVGAHGSQTAENAEESRFYRRAFG